MALPLGWRRRSRRKGVRVGDPRGSYVGRLWVGSGARDWDAATLACPLRGRSGGGAKPNVREAGERGRSRRQERPGLGEADVAFRPQRRCVHRIVAVLTKTGVVQCPPPHPVRSLGHPLRRADGYTGTASRHPRRVRRDRLANPRGHARMSNKQDFPETAHPLRSPWQHDNA
jgi:hypothetical protein